MNRISPRLGALAGPFYVVVSLLEIAFRDGFDPLREPWSALSLGPYGWIHIANLGLSGLAVVAGALAFTGLLRVLFSLYGLSLVGAGIFTVDPVGGAVSFPGLMHFACGAVGFTAVTVAALVVARRFRAEGLTGWAAGSALSGVFFFAGFATMASAGGAGWSLLLFTAGVVVISAWFTALCLRTSQRPAPSVRRPVRARSL
ncbi:DUF998 domain-containing protein [Herbidospora daliensis]|uniref:DUF998 domain-containing protein n=1 Tax=Herbidospora daliensis TaxID=295585 RepID=UPI000780D1E1|nr:DUF998 domain-containing protein [Herbidospora daliensis]